MATPQDRINRQNFILRIRMFGEGKTRALARGIHDAWRQNMKVKTGRARASIIVSRGTPNTASSEEDAISVASLQIRQSGSRVIITQWDSTRNNYSIVISSNISYYDNAETLNALPRAITTGIGIATRART